MKTPYTKSPKTSRKFVQFLYIILVFTCCLFVVTYFFYVLSLRSGEKSQLEQLEDKSSVIDERISQELHDYLYSNLSRPIASVNTFSSFFKSSSSDAAFFQKIRIDLFDHYLLKQDIFNDIVLFRISDEAFVSASRAGYNLESTYTQSGASYNYTDLHELIALEPLSAPMLYITANSRLYYIFPVYQQTNTSFSEYAGFAGLYINPENFFNTDNVAAHISDRDGTTLVIKDESIIFEKGTNLLSEKTILNVITQFTEANKEGNKLSKLNIDFASTEYSFYYTTSAASEDYGLTYLYYEPAVSIISLFSDINSDLTQLYWLSVSVLMVLFIMLIIQRLHIFRKSSFSKDNFTANGSAANTQENYIFKNTIDLLHGNIAPTLSDETLCRIFNIKQLDKYTSCIIIEPEPIAILKMTPEQRTDFMAEITESVKMHSEVTTDTHFAIINYPQHKITCVINSNGFLPETIANNILQHLESVYNSTCHFNVLCSTPSLLISELQRNYNVLLSGLKYSYIYNYNNLFTQEAIERFEASDNTIDAGLASKVRQLFRDHNFDELIKYITSLPPMMREINPSYSRVYDHFRSIFFVMTTYCSTNCTDYPYKDIPPTDLMKQFETIDETAVFLTDFIDTLKNTSLLDDKEQGNTISQKFIDRIIEYINEHIVDVSLGSVAAHFNVSTAHLSRVFKENVGINFSDYVAEQKLQKAVVLLLDDNNYNIGDIAKTLGYNTPAYFSRKFKERFELTPAMYRKQYMTDTK